MRVRALTPVCLAFLALPVLASADPVLSGLVPFANGQHPYSANVTNTVVSVDANPRQVTWYYIYNNNSSACYLQVFDAGTGSVTLGNTAPTLSLGIPALGGANSSVPVVIPFTTAVSIAATTTRSGSSQCANGLDVNVVYSK